MRADILLAHPYKHHALSLAAGCVASGQTLAVAVPFYRRGFGSLVARMPGPIGRKARGYYHPALSSAQLLSPPHWQLRKLLTFLGDPQRIEAPYDDYVATQLLHKRWTAHTVVTLQDHMPKTSLAAKQVGAKLWSDQIINLSAPATTRINAHAREFGIAPQEFSEDANSAVLALADIVSAPSAYTLDGIRERINPAAQVHCVPYGVDARRFGLPRQTRQDVFTVVARAHSVRKGAHLVLRAIQQHHHRLAILARPKRLQFRILGRIEPSLAPMLAQCRRQSDVAIVDGDLPNVDVPELFASADLFLMPTLSESMSLACIEALQAGLPLLVTRYAGLDCFVTERMGLLIDDSVESIVSALEFALSNPHVVNDWSTAARQTARNLTWEHYERAIAEIARTVS
jgi:glycosyltransferase involved in cell wall biosynthesis